MLPRMGFTWPHDSGVHPGSEPTLSRLGAVLAQDPPHWQKLRFREYSITLPPFKAHCPFPLSFSPSLTLWCVCGVRGFIRTDAENWEAKLCFARGVTENACSYLQRSKNKEVEESWHLFTADRHSDGGWGAAHRPWPKRTPNLGWLMSKMIGFITTFPLSQLSAFFPGSLGGTECLPGREGRQEGRALWMTQRPRRRQGRRL